MAKVSVFLSGLAAGLCAVVIAVFLSCSGGEGGVDVDDDSYPSQVTDLRVKAVSPTSVTLEWTAPGDVDTVGTAAAYDMRMSDSLITWENVDAATPLSGEPEPGPFGSTDTMRVTGLEEDDTYYFALKTRSHGGNWSWLSNCAEAVCFDDYEVDFADPNLESVIRGIIGIPSDPIHRSDLLTVVFVDANDRDIASLSGIEHCVNMATIFMTGNLVSDLSPLAGLVEMRHLQMPNNQIADISPLAGMVDLEQLILGGNSISDISAVADMPKLSDVHFGGNQIADITPLSGKPMMTILILSYNNIADIAPLAGMTRMNTLDLADNQIANVAALAGMTQLQWLSLQQNLVTDISPLAGLTQLDFLNLWNNDVADVSALAGLTKLEILLMIGNQVSDITPIAQMTALKKLFVSFNPISDISALSGLLALDEVQAQSCQIVSVAALQALPLLQRLMLDANQIDDIAPLVNNMNIGSGDVVSLVGNPLSTDSRDIHIPALRARGVTVYF